MGICVAQDTELMDDPGAIVIGHSVATSDDINIVSTVNNHQRQDQTQDRGLISWYLCCVLINSLGIYSTSLWLLNLVLNWCKKFIKQPTVCSLHNLKSDCHKMTNTGVTEHYPRLGLFAALNYGAESCEVCWGWTEEQRQDFPNMERHKPCYSRAKVFLPLGIISGNGSSVSKYLAWGQSHTSQTLRHSWMGGESSGSQWVVGISQNSCHNSWEAALVRGFWVEFVFLWCIFTNFVFEMRIVFRKT